MEKIFITGACGMVGSHLAEYYYANGTIAEGTKYIHPTINCSEIENKINLHECDVRDYEKLFTLLQKQQPNIIYHLAAQSYPTVSWVKPKETMDINANGTINIFESILAIKKTNPTYDPIVVVACSSAQYGSSLTPANTPVNEHCEQLPLHPYGVSKVAQDLLAYQYFINNGIKCIRARIFNTTGVRKVQDAISEFTKRAVLIEKKKLTEFACGNLQSIRAIADVKDLVSALVLLAHKGTYGECYNISGDKTYLMKDIVTLIENYIGFALQIKIDPTLLRSTDEPIIFGDSSKLKQATGWQQTVPITTTIGSMIDYWRTIL